MGNAGSVQGILGQLNLENPPDFNDLTIDDSADSTGRTVTLSSFSPNPEDSEGDADVFGRISGLAPGNIQYEFKDCGPAVVNGGTGGNTFNVNSTATGGSFRVTTINGGSNNDTFNIDGAGLGANSINSFNGQNGNDVFNVTSAPAAGVTLNIDGGANTDSLAGPNLANTWNITANNAGNIPGVVNTFTNVENLTGGTNTDSFVFSDGFGVTGTIDGGAGADTLDYSAYTTGIVANLGITVTQAATFGGDQETPPNTSGATGTATLTYNLAARTFDVSITVNGITAGQVTGMHLHLAPVGIAGAIIVPFGAPTPSGGGFTFSATGVALPAANEASFLGDNTYLNVHTATFPGGEIRGQVVRQTQIAGTVGTATGTAGISNFENVNGGAGNDSIVGNGSVNTLNGNAGNDTILGGAGNDTMNGGNNDDTLIWSNGDGTDVMEGGTGNDTAQVNGSVGAGDVFVVDPNGARVNFHRDNLGLFSLDIGTAETLRLNGNNGDDTMTVNSLVGVADLITIALNGFVGNDTFNVTPSTTVTFNVNGGEPRPPAAPGDSLNVNTAGTTTPGISGGTKSALGYQGAFTFGNRLPVNYQQVETIAGTADLTITQTDFPDPVAADNNLTYSITVHNNGPADALSVDLSDTLPVNTSFVSFVQNTGPAIGGTLPAGGTQTFTLVVHVNPGTPDGTILTNTASLTTATPDPNPADNQSTENTTVQSSRLKAWTSAGATGAIDEDSTAKLTQENSAVRFINGQTGTGTIRYNITAVRGVSFYCPATQSTINVRYRNSDPSGTLSRVQFEIHRTRIATGGNEVIYSFNSDGTSNGSGFLSATATPNIDFDFATYVYWVEATIFRNDVNAFADLGAIEIYESAGTPCP